jgi:putative ATP-dependent endonuclease of OLD family
LVEGPSDELIVQRAYCDKFSNIPIQNGIDVISVGLTFKRFLEIAKLINKDISVVTDNDRDFENKITKKYEEFSTDTFIKIFADNRNHLNTLEPQIVDANSSDLKTFAKIVGVDFTKCNTAELISDYLIKNKTDWALKVFEAD